MQYAIIKAGGKQYKVSVGDLVTIDKLSLKEGEKSIIFDEVLLLVDGEKVEIGKPLVKNAKVNASIVEQKKGEKIKVIRFKAKSRYRKTIGFRPIHSIVKIEKIDIGKSQKEEKTSETIKTPKKTEK
jgi:large subunit ribosomal protein L21